jgi:hypothetical protein
MNKRYAINKRIKQEREEERKLNGAWRSHTPMSLSSLQKYQ